MSGSIVSGGGFGISGVLNLGLNALEPAIFGTADPLVVGGMVLVDFEIPDKISWGGTQRIAVHQLPGGERIFDIMGREEEPISWSGIFLGSDAVAKAIQWDVARARGSVLPLQWGTLSYQVVMESFSADYKQRWHIPYKVVFKVLRDNAAPLPSSSPTPEQAVSDDVSSASDSVPTDSSQNVVTKTKAETGVGTSTTQTYAPANLKPSALGLGSQGDAAQAAGNNLGNSSLSTVDAGPPFNIPAANTFPGTGADGLPEATAVASPVSNITPGTASGVVEIGDAPQGVSASMAKALADSDNLARATTANTQLLQFGATP
jgi:hypothetical protein